MVLMLNVSWGHDEAVFSSTFIKHEVRDYPILDSFCSLVLSFFSSLRTDRFYPLRHILLRLNGMVMGMLGVGSLQLGMVHFAPYSLV